MLISQTYLITLRVSVPGMIPQAPIFFARSLGCSPFFLWHGMLLSYTNLLPTWVMATPSKDAGFMAQKKKNPVIATTVHMAELFAMNSRR